MPSTEGEVKTIDVIGMSNGEVCVYEIKYTESQKDKEFKVWVSDANYVNLVMADGFSENPLLITQDTQLKFRSLSMNVGDKFELADSYYSTVKYNDTAFLFVVATTVNNIFNFCLDRSICNNKHRSKEAASALVNLHSYWSVKRHLRIDYGDFVHLCEETLQEEEDDQGQEVQRRDLQSGQTLKVQIQQRQRSAAPEQSEEQTGLHGDARHEERKESL